MRASRSAYLTANICMLDEGPFNSTCMHTYIQVWWPHQQPIGLSVAAGGASTNGGCSQMMCEQKGCSAMETAEGAIREQRTLVAPDVFVYPRLHGWVHLSASGNFFYSSLTLKNKYIFCLWWPMEGDLTDLSSISRTIIKAVVCFNERCCY